MNNMTGVQNLLRAAENMTKPRLPRAVRLSKVAQWLQTKRVQARIQANMFILGGGKA